MKKSLPFVLVAAMGLMLPAAVSACDSYLGYLFMRSYMERTIGIGIQIQPGSDGSGTYLIPTVDVSFPLNGGRGAVKPMIGLCRGDGETEIVFGGGGAYNFWNNPNNTLALDAQVAVTAYSFTGGSEQVIPISVIGRLNSSGNRSFLFGAGFQVGRFSSDVGGYSSTDTDPFAVIGALLGSDNLRLQGGLELKKGDSDIDIAVNAAVAIPID